MLALLASCTPEAAHDTAGSPPREGRFGSLRDLVLIARNGEGRAAPFFVDRFEVTRADWAQFAATPAGRRVDATSVVVAGNPALPVAGVDVTQARAFAKWRLGRLPRRVEWEVAVGDGRHPFPWGSREDWTRANAGELGLGQPTPVGTFESGRSGVDQPYDLIGNVSEWTESVPLGWVDGGLDPGASTADGWRRVLRAPSLAIWQGPGGQVPVVFLVEAAGDRALREVAGGDFQTSMTSTMETVAAGDRRARTGLRVYCSPRELLHAVLAAAPEAREPDLEQLRRFVRRDGHRAVLAAAWREAPPRDGDSAVERLLREELAP